MNVVDAVKLIAAVGTLVVFGYGLTILLAPQTPFDRFERLGIAYLLGTGVASMLWIVFAPLYAIVSPVLLISAAAGLIAGIALTKKRLPEAPEAFSARELS